MLRPAGPPVHDTLLPGEHRVLRCFASRLSLPLPLGPGPRIRVFPPRRVTPGKILRRGEREPGCKERGAAEDEGGSECRWVQFPRARDAVRDPIEKPRSDDGPANRSSPVRSARVHLFPLDVRAARSPCHVIVDVNRSGAE